MGKDPDAIRQQIEETRNQMGSTVDAIGYRTDVRSRAKESVQEKAQGLRDKISGATPDTGEVKDGARQAVGVAQENPIGLALGAVAVEFVAGMLVPSTKVEDDDRLGKRVRDAEDMLAGNEITGGIVGRAKKGELEMRFAFGGLDEG